MPPQPQWPSKHGRDTARLAAERCPLRKGTSGRRRELWESLHQRQPAASRSKAAQPQWEPPGIAIYFHSMLMFIGKSKKTFSEIPSFWYHLGHSQICTPGPDFPPRVHIRTRHASGRLHVDLTQPSAAASSPSPQTCSFPLAPY